MEKHGRKKGLDRPFFRFACYPVAYAVVSGAPVVFTRYRRIVSIMEMFVKPASIYSMSTVRPERIPWISTSAYITSRVLGSFK